MAYEPSNRFGASGVYGLFGPSLESRERKKRNEMAHKRGLDEQIKYRKEMNKTLGGGQGPYGDFVVDKIASSPAPTKESFMVAPLHRSADKGAVEPWVKWDEDKYRAEQSRRARWESFRDQRGLPQGETGRGNAFPTFNDRPLLPTSVSPLTHKPWARPRAGSSPLDGRRVMDRLDRTYESPVWQIGEPNPRVSPIRNPSQTAKIGGPGGAPTRTVSIDACSQLQKAFFAADELHQGLLDEEAIRRVCSLFFVPVVEIDNALSNASGVKNLRDGRIRYNTFLKAICPDYFSNDGNAQGGGLRKHAQRANRQNIWHPWGASSGGGAPVRGPDGRPLADRTEMRRLAGYRIQNGGLRAVDFGLAEAPGAPLYLSGSMGPDISRGNGGGRGGGDHYVSPFVSSPVQSDERNKQEDFEGGGGGGNAMLDRHPIVDFLDSDPNQNAFDVPPQFQPRRQVKHRRSKRARLRRESAKGPRSTLGEKRGMVPTDARNMGDEMIMRSIVQSHEPLPEPTTIPGPGARDFGYSLLDTIPNNEMSAYPEGLKVKELEVEEMKELFSSPFTMTASSSESSLDSEGRERLLTNFGAISKPLQQTYGFTPNPGETSYDRFLNAAKASLFQEA
jgi:hypothetical protein